MKKLLVMAALALIAAAFAQEAPKANEIFRRVLRRAGTHSHFARLTRARGKRICAELQHEEGRGT